MTFKKVAAWVMATVPATVGVIKGVNLMNSLQDGDAIKGLLWFMGGAIISTPFIAIKFCNIELPDSWFSGSSYRKPETKKKKEEFDEDFVYYNLHIRK